MTNLAVAIHERSSKTSSLANYSQDTSQSQIGNHLQPETAASASFDTGNTADGACNPTEVCVVYLREKIAQLTGLVDAID